MKTISFIDGSNIFYSSKNYDWFIDFDKLFKYLFERYNSKIVFYFGGFDFLSIKDVLFFNKLSVVGYFIIPRKIKKYINNDSVKIKSNCDVDISFYIMKNLNNFNRIILFSGGGDFDIILRFLISIKKIVVVFADPKRTAKEIKLIKGVQFNSLNSIKDIIKK